MREPKKIRITGAALIGCHSANDLTQRGDNFTLYDINPNQA